MKFVLSTLATLLLCSSYFAQSWDLLTPMNSGAISRNCSFIDENNGYMVLQAEGDVYFTKDGGVTWNRPWTPGISSNLYDVEMVSSDVIFTCGTQGEIFRSVDAGTSWVEMDTPTSEYLYALDFVSETTGFACGFNAVILKTTDGGETWEIKDADTSNRLYDIHFASELVGIACGWNGTVVRSEDGGETWSALDTGHDGALLNCSLPSEDVGFAVGWNQSIIATTDGGDSWDLQFSNGNNGLNYIEFRDDENGWAAGDWGGFYSTSNGGETWTSSSAFGASEIWGGQYVNETTAFMVGRNLIYKSTDNGATWNVIKNAVPNAKYNGVWFFDDDHGYACGSVGTTGQGANQGGIVYTENGGQTWDTQAQSFSNGWWDIHFANENEGAVIGGGNYMKTANGGNNWAGNPFPESLTGVGIHRINTDEIIAGGSGIFSNICKSSNGGFEWECGENLGAKDFFFLTDDEGWAITEGSTTNIFHTIDGGDSWEYVDTGISGGKSSIFFLDDMTGWIGTLTGSVFRTIDGGATWEIGYLNYDIVGVHFYDELLGFAGDNQGNIWKSIDGGANWEVVVFTNDLTMPVVVEVDFTENYAYAGCWSGEIYRTELGCGSIDSPQITTQTEWCENEGNFIGFESAAVVDSFEWTVPEGWTQEGEFGSIYAVAGDTGGEIGLSITNACGLTATAAYAVEVIPEPAPILDLIAPFSACSGSTFLVEVPEASADISYDWSLSSGWTYFDLGGAIEVTPGESDGFINVFGENECGASDDFSLLMPVFETPEVSIDITEEGPCLGSILTPTVSPEGGLLDGPGAFLSQIDSQGLIADEVYTYAYTFVSDEGCEGSATDDVTFLALPEVNLNFEGLALCLGSEVSPEISPAGGELTGPGVAGDVVLTEGLEAGEVYTYLYAYTAENGCSSMAESSVSFGEFPEVSIDFDGIPLCMYTEVAPNLSPEGGILEGFAVDGDVIQTFFISPDSDYTYTYTYTDENGCSASAEATVSFELPPEVLLGFQNEALCIGNTVEALVFPEGGTLEGEGLNGLFVESDDLIAGEVYPYTYSYTGENGCTGSSNFQLIWNDNPEVSISFEEEVFCTESTYEAIATPEGGIFTGPGVGDLTVQSFFLNPGEEYTYLYFYEDETGCSAEDSVTLVFGQIPFTQLDFDYDVFCLDGVYSATVEPEGGTLTGEGVSGLDVSTSGFTPEEFYDYIYTYEAENGCANTAAFSMEIENCLGVVDLHRPSFVLYPNPSQGMLTVNTLELIGEWMHIYDCTGRCVFASRVESQQSQWDFTQLAKGMYQVWIGDSNVKLMLK